MKLERMKRTWIFSGLLLASPLAAEDRPNFVWVISEDNSKHHMKLFDETGVETPHIEAMAKDGVIFDAVCSNAPVCSVARSTLLTGCYAPRIGAQYHRKQMPVPMPDGLKPFPAYLKQAGYFTSNKGKTDYNVSIPFRSVWSGKSDWKKRAKGQPFFYQLSSLAQSHESRGHFNKEAMLKTPLADLVSKVQIPPLHPDTPLMRYSYASYQDKIQIIDGQVGDLIQKLKDDGVYDNTIIFYFGDHGGILPRSKGYAYETGLNAPLVIRFPDKWKHLIPFAKGSRTSVPVNFYDFGPSLLMAAGIEPDKRFDGQPFLGKGVTKASLEGRPAFGYADRFDEKYDLVRTLRRGKMKYMRNYQPFNQDALHSFYRYKALAYQDLREMYYAGTLNKQQALFFNKKAPEALYDLEKDPYELNNLAADPAHRDTLLKMRKELAGHVKSSHDLSLFPESVLIEHAFANPVEYGNQHAALIATLVDIADLQLQEFASVKSALLAALKNEHPLNQYWALITATSFAAQGVEDAKLTAAVEALLKNKSVTRLNRTRAGEYFAHIHQMDRAVELITEAAYASKNKVELNLILNSAAMVYETSGRKKTFQLDASKLNASSSLVKERLSYLRQAE
ncbi:sulfatase [Verrucomicrobiaceae bacterium N1E253]|uniref:Sulfatase n=1 Tax=Oceaniferula marina TaxID=2748318 RepID=A0A851GJK7_9BACT|nr:sulfatase [Oceaniferula marina]NWK55355.1 sulfatase [Oceaniferula marina]